MTTAPAPPAPPFCPNPACPYHVDAAGWRWQRDGFYSRLAAPHRIQRYRCCHCRRRFGEQTFRCTYWLKRPELLEPVYVGTVACSCLRQMARSLRASPQTILLHSNRLGRHSLLFHVRLGSRRPISEPVALDGFVSYEYSQYHPTSDHHLVGRDSHFFYGFTVTEQRRSGGMTARQRRRRAEIEARVGRPDPRGTEKDVAELLRIACPEPVCWSCPRVHSRSGRGLDPGTIAHLTSGPSAPGVRGASRTSAARFSRLPPTCRATTRR